MRIHHNTKKYTMSCLLLHNCTCYPCFRNLLNFCLPWESLLFLIFSLTHSLVLRCCWLTPALYFCCTTLDFCLIFSTRYFYLSVASLSPGYHGLYITECPTTSASIHCIYWMSSGQGNKHTLYSNSMKEWTLMSGCNLGYRLRAPSSLKTLVILM